MSKFRIRTPNYSLTALNVMTQFFGPETCCKKTYYDSEQINLLDYPYFFLSQYYISPDRVTLQRLFQMINETMLKGNITRTNAPEKKSTSQNSSYQCDPENTLPLIEKAIGDDKRIG